MDIFNKIAILCTIMRLTFAHWILVLLVSNILLDSTGEASTQDVTQCPQTEGAAHAYIIPCLKHGEDFLKRYFRKYSKRSFDKCETYAKFEECINPLLEACPGVSQHIPQEWLTTVHLLNCACSAEHHDHQDCDSSLDCMARELEGVFTKRCEERFQLNIKQDTQSQCHFLHDYIHCKRSLVSSSCGSEAGTMVFLVHQVAAWTSFSCEVNGIPDYQGFQYNDECPVNLATEIDSCLDNTLTVVLAFNPNNDLVPLDDTHAVKKACREYKAYSNCLNKWKSQCEAGVTMAMEQNDQLRVYLLKMHYICVESDNDYISNVKCYKEVLEKDSLSECYPIWRRIEPLLDMTSYEYYCVTDSDSTVQIKSELRDLTMCYKDVLSEYCGEPAGRAMQGLIAQAFQDPFYLRLAYVPDCTLHTREPYDIIVTIAATKDDKSRLRHKHRHHKKNQKQSHSRTVPSQYTNQPSNRHTQTNSALHMSVSYSVCVFVVIFNFVTLHSVR